jgi:hypothetical protein
MLDAVWIPSPPPRVAICEYFFKSFKSYFKGRLSAPYVFIYHLAVWIRIRIRNVDPNPEVGKLTKINK